MRWRATFLLGKTQTVRWTFLNNSNINFQLRPNKKLLIKRTAFNVLKLPIIIEKSFLNSYTRINVLTVPLSFPSCFFLISYRSLINPDNDLTLEHRYKNIHYDKDIYIY